MAEENAKRNNLKYGIFATVVIIIIVIAAVATCLLFYLSSDDETEPILIGATVSLTGKYMETGKLYEEAYKMWVEDVNKKGGLLGRPIELILYDDESNPTIAEDLYEKLITEDKVDFVLGAYSSSIVNTTSSVAEKHKYVYLEAGGTSEKLFTRGYKYIFLGLPGVAGEYAFGFFDYLDSLAVDKKPDTIAFLGDDSLFARSFIEGTMELAEERGYNVIYNETYPAGTPNLTSQITEIKNLGADVLIGGTYFDDSIQMVQTCKKVNYTPEAIFTTIGPADEEFGETLDDDSLYIWTGAHFHRELPASKDWSERYKVKYNRWPDYHAAGGYSICQVLEQSVRATKSTDNTVICDYIHNNTYRTVIGQLNFKQNGLSDYAMLTIQWQPVESIPQNEIVYPLELATNEPIYPMPSWTER